MSFNVNATVAKPAKIDRHGIHDLQIHSVEFVEEFGYFKQPAIQVNFVGREEENVIHYDKEKEAKYGSRKYLELDFGLTYNNEWNKSYANVENFFAQIGGEEGYNLRKELGEELADLDTSMSKTGAKNLAEGLNKVLAGKNCTVAVKGKEWNDAGAENLSFASNLSQLDREYISKDGTALKAKYQQALKTGNDFLVERYKGSTSTSTPASTPSVDMSLTL